MNNFVNFTHPQKRILFSEIMFPDYEMSNVGYLVKIKHSLDLHGMQKAINCVIERNSGARLQLRQIKEGIEQFVADYIPFEIDLKDFTGFEDVQIYEYFKKIHEKRFELYNSPLFYFLIVKFSDKECGFYIKSHHLVADGQTAELAINQIVSNYLNIPYEENNLKAEYLDYIDIENEYQQSARFNNDKNYWLNKYETIPEEVKLSSLNIKNNTLAVNRKYYVLPADLTAKIVEYQNDNKVSLFTIFLEILSIYIYKFTKNSDFTVAIPTHSRNGSKFRNCIGMFVSTMPFRVKINPVWNLDELRFSIKNDLSNDFRHQKYPFDLFVSDLRSKNSHIINFLNCQLIEVPELTNQEAEVLYHFSAKQSPTELAIFINLRNKFKNGILEIAFDYQQDLFEEIEIDYFYERLLCLFGAYLNSRTESVSDIEILTENEKNILLREFNNSDQYEITYNSVIDIFERIVKEKKSNTAVEYKNKKINFGELNRKANCIAMKIISNLPENESKTIGVMLDNSIETIIGILAILKSGCAYVPIDPKYPEERIEYILNDCGIQIILTNTLFINKLKNDYLMINLEEEELYSSKSDFTCKKVHQKDTAYIIYTSGSTGKPKGVEISHKNLLNYLGWGLSHYALSEPFIFPFYSSISFDLTVTSIFLPLLSGGKIIVYQEDDFEVAFENIFKENNVNSIKLTPSHLNIFKSIKYSSDNIKQIIVGGEDLKAELAKGIHDKFNKNVKIYNEYGPTEATVGCAIYQFNPEYDKLNSLSIGKPVSNTQILILDEESRLLPIGAVGEICISGESVAKGYYKNEEKTSHKFLTNPYNMKQRMYKSGDLGRWLFNGQLEYLGRIDNQVKIRGFRIELDEISNAIKKYPDIIDAIAVCRDFENNQKGIFSYFVSDLKIDVDKLSMYLRNLLPYYMIPVSYQQIERIPLTINGKIDEGKLPDFKGTVIQNREINQPSDALEEAMLTAWREGLNIQDISLDDNYFELGGDSIKAIQIVSCLRNAGYKLKVRDILSHITIYDIKKYVEVINQQQYDLTPIKGYRDLLPIENWFFKNNLKNMNYYNQVVLLSFKENIDQVILKKTIQELLLHHDGLRQNYDQAQNKMFYNENHLSEEIKIENEELKFIDSEDKDTKLKQIINDYSDQFNIDESLLLLAVVIKDNAIGHDYLLLIAHHLIMDGVSWRILLQDLYKVFRHYTEKTSPYPWSTKTSSLIECSEAVSSINNVENSYESNQCLQESYEAKSNFDFEFNTQDMSVRNSGKASITISEEITKYCIDNLYSVHSLKITHVIILALYKANNMVCNRKKMILEIEGHGRDFTNLDVSQTIGWFTTIYPVEIYPECETTDKQISYMKKVLNKADSQNINLGIQYLSGLNNKFKISEIRFNYLGEFNKEADDSLFGYEEEYSGLYSDFDNSLTAVLEVDCLIVNSKLIINLRYPDKEKNFNKANQLLKCFKDELNDIYAHLISTNNQYLVGSDFDTLDLSDEELEAIFNEG